MIFLKNPKTSLEESFLWHTRKIGPPGLKPDPGPGTQRKDPNTGLWTLNQEPKARLRTMDLWAETR